MPLVAFFNFQSCVCIAFVFITVIIQPLGTSVCISLNYVLRICDKVMLSSNYSMPTGLDPRNPSSIPKMKESFHSFFLVTKLSRIKWGCFICQRQFTKLCNEEIALKRKSMITTRIIDYITENTTQKS